MNSIHEKECFEDVETRNRYESLMVLARGVSHDINNILTILCGHISLAKAISRESGIVSILSYTEIVCTRASELNRQLMDFSKGESSSRRVIYLPPLIKSITELVLKGVKVKSVFLFENDIPQIVADEVQIQQVFMNLLINAVQAMPGGGTITIGIECVEMPIEGESVSRGKYIKAYVKDEGVGIPERHIPKIFDCNYSTKPNGSGLGLSICNLIVKNHGGYINVDSEEDIGTVFNVYLPAHV